MSVTYGAGTETSRTPFIHYYYAIKFYRRNVGTGNHFCSCFCFDIMKCILRRTALHLLVCTKTNTQHWPLLQRATMISSGSNTYFKLSDNKKNMVKMFYSLSWVFSARNFKINVQATVANETSSPDSVFLSALYILICKFNNPFGNNPVLHMQLSALFFSKLYQIYCFHNYF